MLGPRTGRENIHTLVRPRRALAKQGGVLGTSMGAALPPWVPAPPLWAPTSLLWVLALGTTTWVPTPPWVLALGTAPVGTALRPWVSALPPCVREGARERERVPPVPAAPLWAPTSPLWVLALGTTTWVPTLALGTAPVLALGPTTWGGGDPQNHLTTSCCAGTGLTLAHAHHPQGSLFVGQGCYHFKDIMVYLLKMIPALSNEH